MERTREGFRGFADCLPGARDVGEPCRRAGGWSMTIAEVSKRCGLSADTLLYYERIGLIPPVPHSKSGIRDYDEVESLLFGKAADEGMGVVAEVYNGEVIPSRAFAEGGIHEAIMDYEDNVFFEILAEDLARRDMDDVPIDESNYEELASRIDAYISEFEEHGTDNILVDSDIM